MLKYLEDCDNDISLLLSLSSPSLPLSPSSLSKYYINDNIFNDNITIFDHHYHHYRSRQDNYNDNKCSDKNDDDNEISGIYELLYLFGCCHRKLADEKNDNFNDNGVDNNYDVDIDNDDNVKNFNHLKIASKAFKLLKNLLASPSPSSSSLKIFTNSKVA